MGASNSSNRNITITNDNPVMISEAVAKRITAHKEPGDGEIAKELPALTSDEDINALESYYLGRIEDLEERNSYLYETSKDELNAIAAEVESKFLKTTCSTVCSDLQEQVMSCYLAHPNQSIKCSPQVREFMSCVQAQREVGIMFIAVQ